jgi:hypothetical protein
VERNRREAAEVPQRNNTRGNKQSKGEVLPLLELVFTE